MLDWQQMLARVPETLRRKYGLKRMDRLLCACGSLQLALRDGQYRCDRCGTIYAKLAHIPHLPSVNRTYDPEERAREKQASRDADAEALRSGKLTREELGRKNTFLSAKHARIDWDSIK